MPNHETKSASATATLLVGLTIFNAVTFFALYAKMSFDSARLESHILRIQDKMAQGMSQ
jgi:hypothetical protein